MSKNTGAAATNKTPEKPSPATNSTNVTRSVVFQKNVLKLGVKRAKAEGRSFSNYLNQLLRAALLPAVPGDALAVAPEDVEASK